MIRYQKFHFLKNWDNLQEIVNKTASGRSQIDSNSVAIDLDKTDENKKLVKAFVTDILMGKNPGKITDYIP